MDTMTAAGITARKITRTRSAAAWAAAPPIHDGMFRVMATLHPDCDGCQKEAEDAALMAAVTGSRGATHRRTVEDTVEHCANVKRDTTWVHPRLRAQPQTFHREPQPQLINPAAPGSGVPMVRLPGTTILVPARRTA